MKFLSLTTKKKVYLMTGGGILALVFLVAGVLAPNIKQTKRLHENFVRTKEEVKNLIIAGSTAKLLEKQLTVYQKDMNKLNEGVLKLGSEVAFIEFLEGLAERGGVTQTLQVTQPAMTPQSAYATSAVSFKLDGTFQQVLSYWIDLEKSPYYVNITSFTIQKAGVKEVSNYFPPVLSESVIGEAEQRAAEEPLLTAKLSAVVFWHNGAL